MKTYAKKDYPVGEIRRYLEPGPVVLVSSAWRGRNNIMTMGWHCVMGFEPSLVGGYIWEGNHSHTMIRKSRECVINIPTADLVDQVIGIGNSSGRDVNKFETFGLTAAPAREVGAPLIKECFANFECRLVDTSLLRKYPFFIFEVVKAHVAARPKYPRTLHYRGEGLFMLSGLSVSHRRKFRPEML